MIRARRTVFIAAVAALLMSTAQAQTISGAFPEPPVTATQLSADMTAGRTTSEAATAAAIARITALDRQGPRLNAVITLNPRAMDDARALDAERRAGTVRGPLHGVPVLVKDNVETLGMPTTAGSLALAGNDNNRDAPLIAALRAKGAVILGKTNLSEWANIRSSRSMSGWSAVGGLVRNPYALDRSSCGSSSGSGAAVAAGYAPLAIGTETDGSIVCPASINGLVGLKPTMGLIPRTHVVPISHSQDTAGPMARTVTDTAALFSALIVADPADPVTKDAARHARDYAAPLNQSSIQGVRIGYFSEAQQPALRAVFAAALDKLRAAGADLVEIKPIDPAGMGEAEYAVLLYELKADLNAYLATTDLARVKVRTLEDVIAFNREAAAQEMPLFDQEIFEDAQSKGPLTERSYTDALTKSRTLATQALAKMLADNKVSLIVAPTTGPAWPSDTAYGDQSNEPSVSSIPAIAGTPHLTVPMGLVRGLPVGLSFIGPAFSEAELFAAGKAYETARGPFPLPTFRATADVGADLEGGR